MAELEQIRAELFSLKNEELAKNYKRYLKSPYEFYGVRVPQLRKIAKYHSKNLKLEQAYNLFDPLWNSGNHEEMCIAIFLIQNYKKKLSLEMWRFLTRQVVLNKLKTWDHVDALGTGILGYILVVNPNLSSEIKTWSQDRSPWIRRLSIITQAINIKLNKIQSTILLAEKLCYDDDIYVQKGTGWMLRECCKKNLIQVKEFLNHHKDMKSACLSYAAEKMPEFKKQLKEKLKYEKEHGKERMFPQAAGDIQSEGDHKINSQLEKIKHFKN